MGSSKKNKKRAGRNPTKTELQLRGLLATAQATIGELEKTKQILNGEASAVLEALWNGHQELTIVVTDLVRRVSIVEEKLGIVNEKEEENEQSKSEITEATGDGSEDLQKSEPEGEGAVHQGPEGKESSESPGEAQESGGETIPEEGGV